MHEYIFSSIFYDFARMEFIEFETFLITKPVKFFDEMPT